MYFHNLGTCDIMSTESVFVNPSVTELRSCKICDPVGQCYMRFGNIILNRVQSIDHVAV